MQGQIEECRESARVGDAALILQAAVALAMDRAYAGDGSDGALRLREAAMGLVGEVFTWNELGRRCQGVRAATKVLERLRAELAELPLPACVGA